MPRIRASRFKGYYTRTTGNSNMQPSSKKVVEKHALKIPPAGVSCQGCADPDGLMLCRQGNCCYSVI